MNRVGSGATRYFLIVAMLWAAVGTVLFSLFSDSRASSVFVLACGVSLLELGSLSKLAESVFRLVNASAENRPLILVRTSYWGILKLVSWGIFAWMLAHVQSLPLLALLAGTGTLAVVPLLGGALWSQRDVIHSLNLGSRIFR